MNYDELTRAFKTMWMTSSLRRNLHAKKVEMFSSDFLVNNAYILAIARMYSDS